MIINLKSQTELSGFYIVYYGSTLLEDRGIFGISHLMEHLMCRNFQHLRDDAVQGCFTTSSWSKTMLIVYQKHVRVEIAKHLPVDDFFSWCAKELKQEYKQLEESKFFSLTGLLFEEDLYLELPQKGEHSKIKTNDFTLQVPKIKINTHGLSEIPYINS